MQRVNRSALRWVKGMANDIYSDTQELQAGETKKQKGHAQKDRKETVTAEFPGNGQQTTHEFPGGIPGLFGLNGSHARHLQPEIMDTPRTRSQQGNAKLQR